MFRAGPGRPRGVDVADAPRFGLGRLHRLGTAADRQPAGDQRAVLDEQALDQGRLARVVGPVDGDPQIVQLGECRPGGVELSHRLAAHDRGDGFPAVRWRCHAVHGVPFVSIPRSSAACRASRSQRPIRSSSWIAAVVATWVSSATPASASRSSSICMASRASALSSKYARGCSCAMR